MERFATLFSDSLVPFERSAALFFRFSTLFSQAQSLSSGLLLFSKIPFSSGSLLYSHPFERPAALCSDSLVPPERFAALFPGYLVPFERFAALLPDSQVSFEWSAAVSSDSLVPFDGSLLISQIL